MSFQIKYVYDLVDKLSPTLRKIQGNLQKTANKVNHSARKIGASLDKVKHKMKSLGASSRQLGQKMFLRMTLPLALIGGSFIKAASDFEESINKVDVAFGSAAQSVKDFANTAGKNFGIDRGRALDMAAMFGDMGTSMGIVQGNASFMSKSLVGLAGDLASFKNIGVEQATTALAAVFTGETESLKKLGVVMTETNLKEFALSQGIRRNIKDFSQSEKVLLRYKFVMNATRNAHGDFIRTGEGFANQMRMMQSATNDLRISFGTLMLPIMTKIVNKTAQIIQKIDTFSPATKKLILILGGLALVLPPILIGLGLMATGFAVLAGPVGLIAIAIAAATTSFIIFFDEIKMVYNFLKDKFLGVINSIVSGVQKVGSVLGFGGSDIATNSTNNVVTQQALINQQQSLTAGGQLDINLRGLPKGSTSQFTPVKRSFLNTGVNSTYAGT